MPVASTLLSKANPRIKRLRRLLNSRKARSSEGVFVVEGPVQVIEAIDLVSASPEALDIEAVFVDADIGRGTLDVIHHAELDGVVYLVEPGVLGQALSTMNPQPVAAVVSRQPVGLDTVANLDGPVMVLVDVADPGNVGTLIRTAEAAGVSAVVACGHTADWTNPKVVRSAAGACLRLPIVDDVDPSAVFDVLSKTGRSIVATTVSPDAASYDTVDLRNAVLVLGNEAHGLDDWVVTISDQAVTIPLGGPTESLNVATAGAVLCFEALRQRRQDRHGSQHE